MTASPSFSSELHVTRHQGGVQLLSADYPEMDTNLNLARLYDVPLAVYFMDSNSA